MEEDLGEKLQAEQNDENVEESSIVESTVHTRFARVEEGHDRKTVEVKQ